MYATREELEQMGIESRKSMVPERPEPGLRISRPGTYGVYVVQAWHPPEPGKPWGSIDADNENGFGFGAFKGLAWPGEWRLAPDAETDPDYRARLRPHVNGATRVEWAHSEGLDAIGAKVGIARRVGAVPPGATPVRNTAGVVGHTTPRRATGPGTRESLRALVASHCLVRPECVEIETTGERGEVIARVIGISSAWARECEPKIAAEMPATLRLRVVAEDETHAVTPGRIDRHSAAPVVARTFGEFAELFEAMGKEAILAAGSLNCEAWMPGRIDKIATTIRIHSPAMADTALAFESMAQAMSTPQGRRVLAVQAVEEAVRRCPAGLNQEAFRAVMVAAAEIDLGFGRHFDGPHSAEFVARCAEQGNSIRYAEAVANLNAPLLGRPARWSGGDAKGPPRDEGVARRFLPAESCETAAKGDRWGR